jgi:hypothetical protein
MRGAEPLTHRVRKRLHRGTVADIGAHPHDAELVRTCSERARLDVRDHDLHTRIAESSREGLADATRAARDNRDLGRELSHARS